jgi:aldehyde dehydrogenase (NAD+)
MNYIECGVAEGAKIITGGKRHGKIGYFIEPVSHRFSHFKSTAAYIQTIFGDVTANMTIMKEEIFGPVIVMTPFDTEEEAIEAANASAYGLSAGVFSQNITRCHKVARELKAGTVWVNCFNELHPQVPFGGFKTSGIGRELGPYALDNVSRLVHCTILNGELSFGSTPRSRQYSSTWVSLAISQFEQEMLDRSILGSYCPSSF